MFAKFAEDFSDINSGASLLMLSEVASSLGVTIIGGSIPEKDADQLYNSCSVFGPNGELKAKHRKVSFFLLGRYIEKSTMKNTSFSFLISVIFSLQVESINLVPQKLYEVKE